MLDRFVVRTKTLAAALVMVGCVATSASALPLALDQFRLNGNFTNSGTGGTGTIAGTGGVLSASGYLFSPQQGLLLSGLTGVSDTYTIAIDFYLDDPDDGSYHKLVDTSGLTSDAGLYVNWSGNMAVYTNDTSVDPAGASVLADFARRTLVLTRDNSSPNSEISVYLDGVAQATGVNDISGIMQTGGSMAFFMDDPMSCGGGGSWCPEVSSGFVDDIRLWNSVLSAGDIMALSFGLEGDLDPIPEPTSLLLLGTGLVLVARRMRKKNQAA